MAQLTQLFPTPVLIDRFSSTPEFHEGIFHLCQQAYEKSNKKLTDDIWKNYNVFDWPGEEIKKLKNIFLSTAKEYVSKVWQLSVESSCFELTGWVNFREEKSFHGPHLHPGAHLALTYYVQVVKKGGELCFLDPRPCAPLFEGFAPNELWLHPQEGFIIAFPGYLPHMVNPILKGTRLSISANISFSQELINKLPSKLHHLRLS